MYMLCTCLKSLSINTHAQAYKIAKRCYLNMNYVLTILYKH